MVFSPHNRADFLASVDAARHIYSRLWHCSSNANECLDVTSAAGGGK